RPGLLPSRQAGRATRLHEISRFEKIEGRWYYLDGDFPS
ncbi:YchJ family metal-binding protein, partial [Bordetella pseudohinzii]